LYPSSSSRSCRATTSSPLIGAEIISKLLDPSDRGTAALFADGAGAFREDGGRHVCRGLIDQLPREIHPLAEGDPGLRRALPAFTLLRPRDKDLSELVFLLFAGLVQVAATQRHDRARQPRPERLFRREASRCYRRRSENEGLPAAAVRRPRRLPEEATHLFCCEVVPLARA